MTVAFEEVGEQPLSRFRLRLTTRAGRRAFRLSGNYTLERGAYLVPAAEGHAAAKSGASGAPGGSVAVGGSGWPSAVGATVEVIW